MTEQRISDRHLRPVSGLQEKLRRTDLRVQLVIGADAHLPAVQHLAISTANLLFRLVDSIRSVEIIAPPAKVVVQPPHINPGHDLLHTLVSLGDWAIGKSITAEVGPTSQAADVRLCIGNVVPTDDADTLYAVAAGWRAWVGRNPSADVNADLTLTNPLGPYFAAALLVGEVFKIARGTTRGRCLESQAYSLWTGKSGLWSQLGDGPELRGADLGVLHIVGAGAVGQGFMNIVGTSGFRSCYVVTLDDDRHDITNFNRCFLAGYADDGHLKVDAIKRFRELCGLEGAEFPGTLAQYVSRRLQPGLRNDVAKEVSAGRFGTIISCVDKGTSRHDIRGLGADLVVGGSTLGLSAKANVFDGRPGTPCLACHNPKENDGERFRALEQQLRAMGVTEQRLFLEKSEVDDVDAVLSYLSASEKCGSVGEASLKRYALQSPREFSVSFVSLAAAIILSSRVFQKLLSPNKAPLRKHMTSFSFLAVDISDDDLAVDATCPFCRRQQS